METRLDLGSSIDRRRLYSSAGIGKVVKTSFTSSCSISSRPPWMSDKICLGAFMGLMYPGLLGKCYCQLYKACIFCMKCSGDPDPSSQSFSVCRSFQDGHGLLLGRISQVEKKPDGPGKTPARFIPGTAGLRDGNPAPEFGLVDAQLRSKQFGFLAGFNEVSWLAHRGYRFAARCVIGKLFASWLYAEIYMTQPSAEYPSLISTRQRRSTSSARAEFSNDNKCSAMVNG